MMFSKGTKLQLRRINEFKKSKVPHGGTYVNNTALGTGNLLRVDLKFSQQERTC